MTAYLFGDRYQVGDTLGFGGMSEVYRGRDLRLGRDVAIKVLRADLARDPSFQARFRREAQNAASLNHPAIVAVYDTGETQGESGTIPVPPFIVMEYVDGDTLRDVLEKEGPLPPRRAMEIVADICAALDFSHRHGIVHRDIKPANVMLNRAGAVKVMDFGIARAVADGQATMTATAAVIGTAQYLSRTSPRRSRRRPLRRLRHRLRPLRTPLRRPTLHRRLPRRRRLPTRPRSTPTTQRHQTRAPQGNGRHRPQGAQQEPPQPLPNRRRNALRPRPGALR